VNDNIVAIRTDREKQKTEPSAKDLYKFDIIIIPKLVTTDTITNLVKSYLCNKIYSFIQLVMLFLKQKIKNCKYNDNLFLAFNH